MLRSWSLEPVAITLHDKRNFTEVVRDFDDLCGSNIIKGTLEEGGGSVRIRKVWQQKQKLESYALKMEEGAMGQGM